MQKEISPTFEGRGKPAFAGRKIKKSDPILARDTQRDTDSHKLKRDIHSQAENPSEGGIKGLGSGAQSGACPA